MFRDDFVWGVGTSSYQFEGDRDDVPRGLCIWDTYIEENKARTSGHDAKVACDHIHKYKEDYALMKELGIKNYRFSINWCRILPNGTGEVDMKGVELYRDMIKSMKENGIEPYVTLYHWELPQALEDKGGWLNPEIVNWFSEYAAVVSDYFSDIAQYFFTINEPQCVVGLGYVNGGKAPGKKLPMKDTFQIAHNLLKAHGAAVIALRGHAKQDIKVGYAPTCTVAVPVTDDPKDVEAARKKYFAMEYNPGNWAWNVSWFSDPVILGHYPEQGMEVYKDYLPEITDEDMKLICQPLDFLGQNIYHGYFIKADENGNPVDVPYYPGFPETGVNWPVLPRALYYGMKFAYERYKLPIIVTENGMANTDVISLDGKVHDPQRINYLDRYLSELQRAYDEGIDIKGYFLWSFTDNFEWEQGYHGRFGIVYIDFNDLRRIPKDSAYWYKEIMESNGAKLAINSGMKL